MVLLVVVVGWGCLLVGASDGNGAREPRQVRGSLGGEPGASCLGCPISPWMSYISEK